MAMPMWLPPICVRRILCLKVQVPMLALDVMNKEMLHVQVIRQNITQIYLLAAILSATGEKNPKSCLAFEYAEPAECAGYCKRRKTS